MPFELTGFLEVLTAYNETVWPAQAALLTLCFFLTVTGLRGHRKAIGAIWAGLAFLWAWMGLVFHYGFFRVISPLATTWALLFLVQTGLFLRQAMGIMVLVTPSRLGTWFGVVTAIYATVGYPLLGQLLGHQYPAVPTFGMPCPTTIATFGLLALIPTREAWWLGVIPTVWAILGSFMVSYGIYQDLGLSLAALGYWAIQIVERNTRFAQVFAGRSGTSTGQRRGG